MLVYLGQVSDKREPQFLSTVCRAALALIQGTQPGHPAVQADWPSPGPLVNVNADQVQLVLANLLANAWEAMGEVGGSLRLGLRICSSADIPRANRFPIDWQPQGLDHAYLEVADTGHGIAEADIEKLFDPFFSTKFSGRGLGLPVVLGIVQAHGGAVVVQSEQGRGSNFKVYFPISMEVVSGPLKEEDQVSEPLRGGTILLVDDDELLLGSTAAMIELLGFAVLTAKDGVEAIEIFQRHIGEIRCVITDLTMPRMDGWEVLAALRRLKPALPVLLASGYDKAQVMSGAHPEVPQGFLGKPFSLHQLREAMDQALAVNGG
jgi:CheY-like chemotaxis protein